MKPEYYSIPPLTPAEAFEFIRDGLYHLDTWHDNADYYRCDCLDKLFAVLRGEPGEHDQPDTRPKTFEEMDENERAQHQLIQMYADMLSRDMAKASVFDGILFDSDKHRPDVITLIPDSQP